MFNIVDLVQLKTGRNREDIEDILSSATQVTKEQLLEGNDVYWVGLCKFSWKKKATTKKAAKEWTEFPYLAEGDKMRCIPIEEIEGIKAKDGVMRISKKKE